MKLHDKIVHKGRRALARAGLGHLAPDPGNITPYLKRVEAHERALKATDDVARIFYSHHGRLAHKWDHYLKVYDRHLSKFRGTAVRFLEIGVSHGALFRYGANILGPMRSSSASMSTNAAP